MYYGWIVVALSFFTVALGATVRQSFIVIFPAMLQEFSWSRTMFSVAPALFGLVVSINGFFIGLFSDRSDIKKMIPIGAAVAAAGLVLCFFIHHLWQMIVFFGILCAFGASALSLLPNTIIISNWFVKLRGTAIGIIASGTGAGTLAFIPLLQLVISTWGWRSGYIALALVIGPLLIPLILLFQKSHPAQMGLKPLDWESESSASSVPADGASSADGAPPPDFGKLSSVSGQLSEFAGDSEPVSVHETAGGEKHALRSREVVSGLLRSRRFWICLVQFIIGPLSTMPIITHQAALLQGKGLSSMCSAWIVGVYGLSVFCGMILSGTLSDRIGREWSYSLGTVSILVGTVFLLLIPTGTGLSLPLLFAVFFGLGFGTRPSMDSATAADIFKGRYFGLIYGILQLGLGIGLFGGPILGGFIYDRSGSYSAAIVFCMVTVMVATVCIWAAAPRQGKEAALV
ncbi:MAG: MFS transporter [Spirochaetaceae bacterium]|nr:MAG: MFS transporter [Spirochaetaceae bacterium]